MVVEITDQESNIMALDIGDVRVGVALASVTSLMPAPLVTLANDEQLLINLKAQIVKYHVKQLIIGLPRSMDGQETSQTIKVRILARELSQKLGLLVHFQDEFLSSVNAENLLRTGKKAYSKADIDKLSASIILRDYINSSE